MLKNLAAAALGATLVAGAAHARVFDFSFTDATTGDQGMGQFITGATGSPYTVTGITGEFDAAPILALLPPNGYAANDNLLYYPGYPYLDLPGISFAASNGNDYNLYAYQGGAWLLNSAVDPVGFPQNGTPLTTFSVVAVPEPATWAMMLLGVGGLGLALRSRRKPALASA